jgi:putative ABC transport system permease protein
MNSELLLHLAGKRLLRHRTKTALIALGIVLSVAAAVLLQTLSTSFRSTMFSFIQRAYPADNILLAAGSSLGGGGNGTTSLKPADVTAVTSTITGIRDVAPVLRGPAVNVTVGANSARVDVVGVSDKEESVRGRSVQAGQGFSADDIANRSHSAVIGATTARLLFGDHAPIGERIFLNSMSFTVVGVLERVGVDPHGNDLDNVIDVPYTTLMEQVLHVDYLTTATFAVADPGASEDISSRMSVVLRERHQIGAGQTDDFKIVTPTLMRKLVNGNFRTFDTFIAIITALAFLLSAALILSVMLISIKERTAEIGLRMALGARRSDVLRQILFELAIVSLVAAVLGLVLSLGGVSLLKPVLAAKFGIHKVAPTPFIVAVSMIGAVLAALLGGLIPARRAAMLDPVQALR